MKTIQWVVGIVIIAALAAGAYYYLFMMTPPAPVEPGTPATGQTPETPSTGEPTKPGTPAASGNNEPPNVSQTPTTPPGIHAPAQTGTQVKADPATIEWGFTSVGTAAAPKTKISVNYNGGFKEIATVDGDCKTLAASGKQALPNEVNGVICLFEGVGTEIAVFKEGEIYVVMKGKLQEPTESRGSIRGDFTVVFQM